MICSLTHTTSPVETIAQLVTAFVASGADSSISQYVVHIGMRVDPVPLDVLKLDVRVALDLIPINEDGIKAGVFCLPTAFDFKPNFKLATAILLDIIVAMLIAAKRWL